MSARENVNRAGELITIITAMCGASSVVVGLRLYVRSRMTKQSLGADDIFMIAAALLNIAETTLICITTRYGLGRHIDFVKQANFIPFFQLAYGTILVYISLIIAIKTSLILFYRRLTPSAYFHAWCWGYIGLNTAIWVTFTTACALSCSPIPYFWDRSIPGGKCVDLGKVYLVNAALFVITDVAALLLPIKAVWDMNMKRRQKMQFIGLFAFGFFVCIASFVRMTTLFNFGAETDATYSMVKSDIWSMVEINVGIVTVCAPIVKPYFTRYLWTKITGLTYNSESGSRSGPSGGIISGGHQSYQHHQRVGSRPPVGRLPKGHDDFTMVTEVGNELGKYSSNGSTGELEGRNSASTSTRELQSAVPGESERSSAYDFHGREDKNFS